LTNEGVSWDNGKGYKGIICSLVNLNFGDAMRVITGKAGGKKISAPEGLDVRPTPERVKEGIFSAIQFDIEGRRVLDLFAGSGQLGIEALSRGAMSATFVDSSASSIKFIRSNLEATGLMDSAKVVSGDYASFLAMTRDTFDIVFLDPPYGAGLFEKALEKCTSVMSDYGIILLEHPKEIGVPNEAGDFAVSKEYRYGKVLVTCYRRKEKI